MAVGASWLRGIEKERQGKGKKNNQYFNDCAMQCRINAWLLQRKGEYRLQLLANSCCTI